MEPAVRDSGRRRHAARGGIARRTWTVGATLARSLADPREPVPRRVRRAFVELGPTFVKVGQVIASSPGLFPPEWTEEFGALRDRVPPFPGALARRIVEEDLARPLRSVFASFDDEPLAAASIGQVHAATLLDGREVVVKVQRPGLDDQVRDELRALLLVCEVLEHIPQTSVGSPRALAEDFARTLHEEMDFRLEADNMRRMQRLLTESGITDCRVPLVHGELVGRRVLTMERIRGLRFTDVEGMRARGIDTARLLRLGVQTVVEGVIVHGFFHGDLHAGNISVLDDGTFVLFDFGIVGRLTDSARARLAMYLMAVTTNDYPSMVRALRAFGSVPVDVDVDDMAATIQELYEPFVRNGVITAQLGELMDTMIRSMVRYRVRIPRELVLLSKQMLYLEGAARTLAPNADLLQEQQMIYGALMAKYPDLAVEIMTAIERGRAMDAAVASRTGGAG
ncbi:MAG: AarF/ABC1/UbiB kinase family protein [Actinobacteria bacterium]|nr:AarF/ABC1/UbiB kinase family protein [Actinomycetota bacterium]